MSDELKSAWDVTRARLEKTQGPQASLSAEQKKAVAEIQSRLQARIAEAEILGRDRVERIRASGDAEKLREAEEQMRVEIARLREKAEAEKASVRGEPA